MLSINELERVILRNDDVGIAYAQVNFPWGIGLTCLA